MLRPALAHRKDAKPGGFDLHQHCCKIAVRRPPRFGPAVIPAATGPAPMPERVQSPQSRAQVSCGRICPANAHSIPLRNTPGSVMKYALAAASLAAALCPATAALAHGQPTMLAAYARRTSAFFPLPPKREKTS